MDYNEFSEKIKTKYPQYQNIDNKELAQKMIAKYPEYKEQVSFDIETPKEQPKGIDLTPAGIINNTSQAVADAILTPLEMVRSGEANPKKAYSTVAKRSKEFDKEYRKQAPILSGARDLGLDLVGYSMLPLAKGGNAIANFAKNAVVQGGVPMALESLKRGGNVLSGLTGGSLLGAAVQGVPYVGRAIGKTKDLIPRIASKAAQIETNTLKQAVKPTSRALDLTKEEADRLAQDTTERLRNDYDALVSRRGDAVGNLLKELPEDKTFKAGQLLNNYDSILNSYSLSKNPKLNPARNATEKELSKIEDLVYGDTTGNLQNFKNEIDALKYPNGKLETVTNRYKNQYYKKTVDDIGNDITIANRRFNDEILGNLKQHPEWVNDPSKIEALEKQISSYHIPEDYQQTMFDKLYEAISKGDALDKTKTPVTPKELYDINKNIDKLMINWDKPGTQLKNNVLEQIYLSNAKKLSDLSPELAQANKAFAEAKDYVGKKSRLRNVLNPNRSLEDATKSLKNYKSTDDSIFELQNLLENEGAVPYLNDIDDVVAAQDLLKKEGTGLGGLAGLVKELAVRPSLKAVRAYNRSNLSNVLSNVKQTLSPLAQKLITPLAVKGVAPLLYGGVQYNDVQ